MAVRAASTEDGSRPLVSVVIPTRNRVALLARAVQSVLTQSEGDFELIVVDDASSDGTQAYLGALAARDARVRVIRNAVARGGGGARNEGVARSRGEWVAFLDDDDEWMPAKLQCQLETLSRNASAVACSCNYIVRFSWRGSKAVAVPSAVTLQQLLYDNSLGSASMCLCSRKLLTEIGGFDARLASAQDLDLWVRLRQQGEIVACGKKLALHRAHQGPRISTNMQSQYLGARHFYFKHRCLMDRPLRRHRLAYNCFIMSRQPTRGLRHRMHYLILSILNSSSRFSLSYAKSSVPRLIRDVVKQGLALRSPRAVA